MGDSVVVTLVDNSGEQTSFSVPLLANSVSSGDADSYHTALVTKVSPLVLGVPVKATLTSSVLYPAALPTDVNANREVGVTFTMQGVTNPQAKARCTLGAPDLSEFPFIEASKDVLEFPWGVTIGTALSEFIVYLNGMARHPLTGEAMTVVRMEKVGRNL